MSNLKIWDKVKDVPQEAQKKITGGRLGGMTDIKPQWRMFKITEELGPVGVGWYYTIEKQWLEHGDGVNVSAFTNINLYIKFDGEWSKPIPGTGGSSYIAQERNGVHTSDEAFKMALTDALSVAMKALGIGATIYAGGNDYSKYTQNQDLSKKPQSPAQAPTPQKKAPQEEAETPTNTISEPQRKRMFAIAGEKKVSNDEVKSIVTFYGYESSKDILKKDYEKICGQIENFVSVETIGN